MQTDDRYEMIISEEEQGERVDKWAAAAFPSQSRSFLQKLIENEQLLVNGMKTKAGYKLRSGDEIELTIPEATLPEIVSEDIPLEILYEDEYLLVVNKPKGMVVHPAPGHYSGTLVNAALFHCAGDLSGINGVLRPGVVHRIDRDTTGALVMCKNNRAHDHLAAQFQVHSIEREYRAIITGHMKESEGTIRGAIGRDPKNRLRMSINERNGKPAVTHYRVLEEFPGYSYISCRLETGRTHQIRVHFSSMGHPLLGDELYGGKVLKGKTQGQCLHAMTLGFVHPESEEMICVTAPLPEYFERILSDLRQT